MKKLDVLIGIPSYDRKICVETASALTNTVVELLHNKITSAIFYVSGCALVTHARNSVIAEFMHRREKTHLLFVDADMDWSPHTILRMLKANVPIVAAPYAKKSYRNTPLSTYQVKDLDTFHAAAMDWNVVFEDPGVWTGESRLVEVQPGFVRAVRIGAGLMLLRRDMVETMISKFADTEYRWDGQPDISAHARFFGLFDTAKDQSGRMMSEDYAFCDRWIKGCGGEIWCDINARVGHHGHHRFAGSLQESLRLRGRQPKS